MPLFFRALPALITIVLMVYCLIDCIQTDESRSRNLPKMAWVLLIVFLPVVGSVAWLVAGRPERSTTPTTGWPSRTAGFPEYERPARRQLAPDDDPAFLAELKKTNTEHEDMLKKWENDLREREKSLQDKENNHPTEGDDPPQPKG